jgi:hypothetical protein
MGDRVAWTGIEGAGRPCDGQLPGGLREAESAIEGISRPIA